MKDDSLPNLPLEIISHIISLLPKETQRFKHEILPNIFKEEGNIYAFFFWTITNSYELWTALAIHWGIKNVYTLTDSFKRFPYFNTIYNELDDDLLVGVKIFPIERNANYLFSVFNMRVLKKKLCHKCDCCPIEYEFYDEEFINNNPFYSKLPYNNKQNTNIIHNSSDNVLEWSEKELVAKLIFTLISFASYEGLWNGSLRLCYKARSQKLSCYPEEMFDFILHHWIEDWLLPLI